MKPQVSLDRSWVGRALCANDEPDSLFVQGAAQREASRRCLSCQVRMECLVDSLQCEAKFGVWGGLTERERRALLRRHSGVEDWQDWIENSDDEYAQGLRQSQLKNTLALVRD